MNEPRQGSVKATTVCFVFCLAREDLNTVLNQFPTLRASLEARARERLQELYLSEKRPLESIVALFSDPSLETQYTASGISSGISELLKKGNRRGGGRRTLSSNITSSAFLAELNREVGGAAEDTRGNSRHSVTTEGTTNYLLQN